MRLLLLLAAVVALGVRTGAADDVTVDGALLIGDSTVPVRLRMEGAGLESVRDGSRECTASDPCTVLWNGEWSSEYWNEKLVNHDVGYSIGRYRFYRDGDSMDLWMAKSGPYSGVRQHEWTGQYNPDSGAFEGPIYLARSHYSYLPSSYGYLRIVW
jgi:hypothetical protein